MGLLNVSCIVDCSLSLKQFHILRGLYLNHITGKISDFTLSKMQKLYFSFFTLNVQYISYSFKSSGVKYEQFLFIEFSP